MADYNPMTDAQRIQLETLAKQVGEPFAGQELSEAEASEKINELQQHARRVQDGALGKESADDDYQNNPDMSSDPVDDI